MMHLKNCSGVVLAVLLFTGSPAGGQTVYYVDQVIGNDSNNGLSEQFPFATIGWAVLAAGSQPSSRIRIKSGVYDQAYESANPFGGFPIPVTYSSVTVEGFDSSSPEIGGDVGDSAVRGLFEVLATSAVDAVDIVFKNLEFRSEDLAGSNAPSAVYVESAGGKRAGVEVTNCVFPGPR